ncbi:thioredoxin family protein [Fodinibius halophilus]|uniref:Thioredoxin family protein n=1 Tax=Fodinibius halophilus TaxID=1736908 RepID=A0A6M1TBQ8_9BACT|nr:thioredoxin family protein [Fodinibius halophilus]NGP87712.1 thioredoxin family protein [Fodinibius halophilus]
MNTTRRTYFLGFTLLLLLWGTATAVNAQQLQWHSFEEALDKAQQQSKPVVIDVWAPWCGWCYKMKNETYPQLSETVKENFIFTRINRDSNEDSYRFKGSRYSAIELAQKFRVNSVPGIVILSAKGEYILHMSGFRKANKLEQILQNVRKVIAQQQKCCAQLHGR